MMELKIIKIINEILKNKGLTVDFEIKESSKLREDLNFDSFDLAELTVYVEEEFGVDIFENGVVNSLGEIYKIVKMQHDS